MNLQQALEAKLTPINSLTFALRYIVAYNSKQHLILAQPLQAVLITDSSDSAKRKEVPAGIHIGNTLQ